MFFFPASSARAASGGERMGGKEWREEKLSPRSASRRSGRAGPGRCKGAAGPLIKRWRRGAGDRGAMRGVKLAVLGGSGSGKSGRGRAGGRPRLGRRCDRVPQPFASFSQRWRCGFWHGASPGSTPPTPVSAGGFPGSGGKEAGAQLSGKVWVLADLSAGAPGRPWAPEAGRVSEGFAPAASPVWAGLGEGR